MPLSPSSRRKGARQERCPRNVASVVSSATIRVIHAGITRRDRAGEEMSIRVESRCCRMLPICGGQIGNVGLKVWDVVLLFKTNI